MAITSTVKLIQSQDSSSRWRVYGTTLDSGAGNIGKVGATSYAAGNLFNVTTLIPKGATITAAKLNYLADANRAEATCNLTIRIVDADNPSFPLNYAQRNALNWSATTVAWDGVEAWTNGTRYDSPDISALIQILVDRVLWVPGNSLLLEVIDNGSSADARRSYGGAAFVGLPYLTITYTSDFALTRQIGEANDDYRAIPGSSIAKTDTTMYWGWAYEFGMVFEGLDIPKGQTLSTALLYPAYANNKEISNAMSFKWVAADNQNASPANIAAHDGYSLTTGDDLANPFTTGASVNWGTGISVKTGLQEVVNRAGWSSGNAALLILKKLSGSDTDYGAIYAFDNASNRMGPILYVTLPAVTSVPGRSIIMVT